MIDFHSHILPGMDDGAKDVNMSISMLKESYRQGVRTVLATPHCYPKNENSIENFLIRRNMAYEELKERLLLENEIPKIILGCEINLTCDIAEFKNLQKICIPDTNYLLVEMPHGKWEEWMVDTVYKLTLLGIKPIMAHIDRYMINDPVLFHSLSELDVLYQVNTDLFIARGVKKITNRLIDSGHIHILGTDMHNLNTRKPNMEKARSIILKRYGETFMEELLQNSYAVLENSPPPYTFLTPKRGFSLFNAR